MKSIHSTTKTVVLAVALAAAFASTAYADDNSMSIWTGDSYRAFNGGQNFPYGSPELDRAPSTFHASNPQGLTNAQYAALSEEDPVWQPQAPVNTSAQREASAEALAWRRENPHGMSESEYESLSSNSPIWQLPVTPNTALAQGTPTITAAQLRDRFARLFGVSHATSAN